MWLRYFAKGGSLLACLAFAGLVHASNLIVNGSFEDPVVPPGSSVSVTSMPGWAVHPNGVQLRDQNAGQAYEGSNFVQLVTSANSSIWQQIHTSVGYIYDLSFAYAPHIGVPASGNGISVYWNDTLIANIAQDGTGGSSWTRYLLSVVGTGNDLLTFAASGTGTNGVGGGLDGVRLDPVPLPGAALLFGTSVLGYWGIRRRKSRDLAMA